MANIAIVNYCNLKCPYCFADDMIKEKSLTMSIDDFRQILDFISRTPKNHIGIIGGEPTLHPNFSDFIREVNIYCRELNSHATLFTNGIELEKYLPELGERIGMLINVNDYRVFDPKMKDKLLSTLDRLAELSMFDMRANLGCNVYPGCTDYDFIWKLTDKYHIDHIRTSAVSPGGQFACMRNDKEAYYTQMRDIFYDFCIDAKKHGVHLNIDCGHVPMCYFSASQAELVREVCPDYEAHNDYCEPVVDIKPDFKATPCFGAYDPVDIRDFPTLIDLERYLLLTKNAPKAEANCIGRCTTCKKHELKICQGGCLGFAQLPGGDSDGK